MTRSPARRIGSFAAVRYASTSPNSSSLTRRSLLELVETDPWVDFARHGCRNLTGDLARIVGVPEDPHQLHEGRLGQHVLAADHARAQEVAPRVVHPHPDAAVQSLSRHHHPL